jgi:hypothetical protein
VVWELDVLPCGLFALLGGSFVFLDVVGLSFHFVPCFASCFWVLWFYL